MDITFHAAETYFKETPPRGFPEKIEHLPPKWRASATGSGAIRSSAMAIIRRPPGGSMVVEGSRYALSDHSKAALEVERENYRQFLSPATWVTM